MKTTVEIADHLLVAAKQHVATQHVSLRTVFETGIRLTLAARPPRGHRTSVRWVTTPGGVGADIDSRVARHARVKLPPR